MAKTLIAIAAHADDAELNAGGTLAKWAAQGGQVHVIMMTDNCSGIKADPEKCAAIRYREQDAAAKLYGGAVHYMSYAQRHYWSESLGRQVCVDYGGGEVPGYLRGHMPLVTAMDDPAEVEKVAQAILGLSPDLVLTQTPLDNDPEHHAVTSMVWRAFRAHDQRLQHVPLRYWMPGSTCQDGLMDLGYDCFEDISDCFDRKLELCAAHASQMGETRWAMVKDRAAWFGQKIGVKYAEPFTTATREKRFHRPLSKQEGAFRG